MTKDRKALAIGSHALNAIPRATSWKEAEKQMRQSLSLAFTRVGCHA